jgi:hypothetical protein
MSCKAILLAALGSLSLNAGTIVYTDFGLGQAFDNTAGWNIALDSSVASGFDPTSSGSLSQIDLALSPAGADTPPILPLSMMLETDSAGIPSGTVLDSWTLTPAGLASVPQVHTFLSGLNPTLTHGSQYWLVLSSSDTNDYLWMINNTGANGKDYNNGMGWVIQPGLITPAFDVETGPASSKPEPSTLGLASLALILLALRFR